MNQNIINYLVVFNTIVSIYFLIKRFNFQILWIYPRFEFKKLPRAYEKRREIKLVLWKYPGKGSNCGKILFQYQY